MIDLSQYTPAIQVELEPGAYALSTASAVGKSYLCSLLHKLSKDERVDSYTYKGEGNPVEILDNAKNDLVLLDRYEMYMGLYADEISKFAQKGIVLISCKTLHYPVSVQSCFLQMYQDKLVVR